MWRYPIYLDLAGKTAVLIAGEKSMSGLAEEKTLGLLDAGATVKLVAARVGPGLARLVRSGRVTRLARDYHPGDLAGAFLAVVVDRRQSIAAAVWREAQERNLLVNTVDDVAHCNFIAPAIVRRGDLTVAISTGGRAPALAVRLRQRLERELGEEHARFLELAAVVRAPLAERCPDLARRRELWYRLVDSDVLDLLRRGEERAAQRRFAEILDLAPGRGPGASDQTAGKGPGASDPTAGQGTRRIRSIAGKGPGASDPTAGKGPGASNEIPRMTPRRGAVYLVGAGPGDPRLITVRGLECLRRAEVVVYDRLVNPALLAEAPAAEHVFAGKTSGASGAHGTRQEEINRLLVDHARAGRSVVRLKGGDAFVFGRGGEEALACAAAGIDCEVVPGVSSSIAVPARAGIPVTHRGVAGGFAVVTGHCMERDRLDWGALARIDTVVVLMGLERLPEIASLLLRHGRSPDTPAAVIAQGTLPEEQVLVATLGEIAGAAARAGLQPPATIVIGEVVRLRERLLAPAAPAQDELLAAVPV